MSEKLNLDFLVQMIGKERENFESSPPPAKEGKKQELSLPFLIDTIREVREGFDTLREAKVDIVAEDIAGVEASAEQFVLSLPKFTPSEAWGRPNHQARKSVEPYIRAIPGRGITEKLKGLMRIQNFDESRISGTRRIISSLVLLESLSAVVRQFSASAAGFVFEGFLAALFGGEQVADPRDGTLPIEDIYAFSFSSKSAEQAGDIPKGVPVSLKLLSSGTDIKGSYTNMVDALDRHDEMFYIVATKAGGGEGGEGVQSIELATFRLTKENVHNILRKNFDLEDWTYEGDLESLGPKNVKKEKRTQIVNLFDDMKWSEKVEYLRMNKAYTKGGKEETGKTQWSMTYSQLAELGNRIDWRPAGKLNLSPEEIKKTAVNYMKHLEGSVTQLFTAVQELSNNINLYFVQPDRESALRKGESAVKNAEDVETGMKKQIEEPVK